MISQSQKSSSSSQPVDVCFDVHQRQQQDHNLLIRNPPPSSNSSLLTTSSSSSSSTASLTNHQPLSVSSSSSLVVNTSTTIIMATSAVDKGPTTATPNVKVSSTSTTTTLSTKANNTPSAWSTSLKSFLSGGVGGLMAVLVGHPFDLVKVRMQTGVVGNASVFGTLRSTLAKEGVPGLYRGVSAPIVAVSPIFAVSFWGYDLGQNIVKLFRRHPDKESQFTLTEISIAGGISALPTTAIMAPTERIKCLLQVQTSGGGGKPQYSGMTDCAVKVYKAGGITSVYKGTALTLMRDVPGSIAWFGTYEIIKRKLIQWQGLENDPSKLSPLAVLCAGGFAGMACWTVSIPADVLKSRYQTAPDGKYSNFLDVYRTLMREEGFMALFTGFRPAMIRAFPANAACFLGMEVAKKGLSFLDQY